MPVKTNEREYRKCSDFQAHFRSLTDETEEYAVEGYAATFDREYELFRYGDHIFREVIDKNAFSKCDMSDVIMQYDHMGRVFARTRNKTLTLTTDETGLHVRAELGGTDIGKQLWQEIRGGYTDKMSFGFTVSDDKRERRMEGGFEIVTRRILGISKLYDVSAVSIPANDTTSISARSFCDGVIAELEAERRAALELARQKLALRIRLIGG